VIRRIPEFVQRARTTFAARSSARTVLIVLSHSPFDGDTIWNALRLASTLQGQGVAVRVFVMNDAIDLVRQGAMPADAEFDLQGMLRALLAHGGRVKVCTTCVTRCGMASGDVMPEVLMATMGDLATWVTDSDRALAF
jgi:uncharacterized protein involved in oxidation of intracellular sulfur